MTTMTKTASRNAIRLQGRDWAIGEFLEENRYATVDQICRAVEHLAGGSHQQTRRRMTALEKEDYVVRPMGEPTYWAVSDSRERVYGNKSKMSRLLRQRKGETVGRLDIGTLNSRAKGDQIEHAVETTEVVLTFEQTVRKYDGFRLMRKADLYGDLPLETQMLEKPWYFEGLPKGFPAEVNKRAYSDEILGVGQQVEAKQINQFFPVEIDCVTESVVAGARKYEKPLEAALAAMKKEKGKSGELTAKAAVNSARYALLKHNVTVNQRSFVQKAIWYYWAHRNDWHKNHFGWPAFRVLFVTRTDSQIARMQVGLNYVTDGRAPNLFYFTTFKAMRECEDVLRHTWLNGAGDEVSILAK